MSSVAASWSDAELSLYHLLDPDVLANPYPLYHRLRACDPVHWDPFLHAWVVTRYADVITVLQRFSAQCTPTADQLSAMGLAELSPIAGILVRQMLFMNPPAHTRIRTLAAAAFTPARVDSLRHHIQDIVDDLLAAALPHGRMELMSEFANRLPATVTAEMLGVPTADRDQLKAWSADFAQLLGNFQQHPDRARKVLKSTREMSAYFAGHMTDQRHRRGGGLIGALATAEVDGDRLSDEEVIANCILTMVGAQETTSNLIGNGLLTLLRHPQELERLRRDPELIPSAIEELLRFESPSQNTARLATADTELGDKIIRERQGVIAVLGAANRDPDRFPQPDRLDVSRKDNRHLAFGWASHFCFGAPLARMEGQIAFATLIRRMEHIELEPAPVVWRENLGLRGLRALNIRFSTTEHGPAGQDAEAR